MADETGLVFVIDGAEYEAPTLATFDMSERRVMFDLAGVIEEDFVRQEDETEDERDARVRQMTRHPGFMEALMHVAYQRGNQELTRKKVQALIDKTNYKEAIAKWGEADAADDANPPVLESTSALSEALLTRSSGSNETSGDGSTKSSDQPDETSEGIGTSESDTSHTSVRSLSVV